MGLGRHLPTHHVIVLVTEQDVPCVTFEQRARGAADVTAATRSGGIVEAAGIDVGHRAGQNLDIHVYFNHLNRGHHIFFFHHCYVLLLFNHYLFTIHDIHTLGHLTI